MKDPIVAEVRKIRDEHAKKFKYDLHAICEDIKQKEKNCKHPVVSLPPRSVLRATG